MAFSIRDSRTTQRLGVALVGAGVVLAVVFPGTTNPGLVYGMYALVIIAGLVLIRGGRPSEPVVHHPEGSRPLLLGGLAVGAVGALVANGVLMPPSDDPTGVYAIGAALLLGGFGLVHRGRSTQHLDRLVLGFVIFTACVGGASFLLYKRAQGWSLGAIPIAVLGLWAALALELGGSGSRRGDASS